MDDASRGEANARTDQWRTERRRGEKRTGNNQHGTDNGLNESTSFAAMDHWDDSNFRSAAQSKLFLANVLPIAKHSESHT
ncbi:hypothetical protein D3C84_1211530 [compost metagenome]